MLRITFHLTLSWKLVGQIWNESFSFCLPNGMESLHSLVKSELRRFQNLHVVSHLPTNNLFSFQPSKAKRSIGLIKCRMWAFVVLCRVKAFENGLPPTVLSANFHSKTEHKIKHNQICLVWTLGIGSARTLCLCPSSAGRKWKDRRYFGQDLTCPWPLILHVIHWNSICVELLLCFRLCE